MFALPHNDAALYPQYGGPVTAATVWLLPISLTLVAVLYASVGHGGASGYLAVMALLGVAPATMRPAALVLNVVVASLALWHFARQGLFAARLFWPLALGSIPAAFLGGRIALPEAVYRPVLGVVLVCAAAHAVWSAQKQSDALLQRPPITRLIAIGAALGLVSGVTGVGGGIFLSPLLLLLRWAPVKTISGVSAAFILVNSIAGLVGLASRGTWPEPRVAGWVIAVAAGGWLGAMLGSRRFKRTTILYMLAIVLLMASSKMLLR